ncbi:MAG: hypothetical protein ACFFG0_17580 [Candidatus Thorarchaeota archaeon]
MKKGRKEKDIKVVVKYVKASKEEMKMSRKYFEDFLISMIDKIAKKRINTL